MTNTLVGDVYAKIIEEVVNASQTDFEENGVPGSTLKELEAAWQHKLSQRGVAQMPWDPKPQPAQPPAPVQQTQPPPSSLPSATANGLPPQAPYPAYDSNTQAHIPNGGARIKQEPGSEQQFHSLPTGYPQNGNAGLARATQLIQDQYGNAASASLHAMQQRGGLALPGQQPKPQGLPSPSGAPQGVQLQFQQQQQAAMARQQQQLAQQQAQPRIKVENVSPQIQQGAFQQRPNYNQTDGADEGMEEWRAMLADRRAAHAEKSQQADRMMHDHVMRLSEDLQSGLMVPLHEQPSRLMSKRQKRSSRSSRTVAASSSTAGPSIPQLDGDADDDEEKPDLKDEDDENAINSDLDDSDDETGGQVDDEDELGDSILCTYDKVQRVKNKWKCTLKDGVMSVGGKEWVFLKGMGEFEW